MMSCTKRAFGFFVLVIFLITQTTWSFNNCSNCLSKAFNNVSRSEIPTSCCKAPVVPEKDECNSCEDECRCSSLRTYDDLEAYVSSSVRLTGNVNEQETGVYKTSPYTVHIKADSYLALIRYFEPPPLSKVGISFYKTDILRN